MTRTDSIVVGVATTAFVTIAIALVQLPSTSSGWTSYPPLSANPTVQPRSLFGAWYSAWYAASHAGTQVECPFEPDIFCTALNVYCAILGFFILRGQVERLAVWCLGTLGLLLTFYSVGMLYVVVRNFDPSAIYLFLTYDPIIQTYVIPLSIAASITLVLRLTLPRDTSAPIQIPHTGSSAS